MRGPFQTVDQFIELQVDRFGIAVLTVWMRNTITNVMMVVPVLITSCQVSENSEERAYANPEQNQGSGKNKRCSFLFGRAVRRTVR